MCIPLPVQPAETKLLDRWMDEVVLEYFSSTTDPPDGGDILKGQTSFPHHSAGGGIIRGWRSVRVLQTLRDSNVMWYILLQSFTHSSSFTPLTRAQQRMHFLRRMKRAHLRPSNSHHLLQLHRGAVESMLTSLQCLWLHCLPSRTLQNKTKQNKKRCLTRTHDIRRDTSHPHHGDCWTQNERKSKKYQWHPQGRKDKEVTKGQCNFSDILCHSKCEK